MGISRSSSQSIATRPTSHARWWVDPLGKRWLAPHHVFLSYSNVRLAKNLRIDTLARTKQHTSETRLQAPMLHPPIGASSPSHNERAREVRCSSVRTSHAAELPGSVVSELVLLLARVELAHLYTTHTGSDAAAQATPREKRERERVAAQECGSVRAQGQRLCACVRAERARRGLAVGIPPSRHTARPAP